MPGTQARAYDWRDALDAARLIADVLGVEIVIAQGPIRHSILDELRSSAHRTDKLSVMLASYIRSSCRLRIFLNVPVLLR